MDLSNLAIDIEKEINKTAYASDGNNIRLEGVDITKDFMLIDFSCGRGKTTWALDKKDDLINLFNRRMKILELPGVYEYKELKREDIWLVTSRTAIVEQQLSEHQDTTYKLENIDFLGESVLSFEGKSKANKIGVCTAHKLAAAIKDNRLLTKPRLLILDEFHSIASETVFAADLWYLLNWLEGETEIMKIGMTATPNFLINYVQREEGLKGKYNFKTINRDLGYMYTVDKIDIYTHTTFNAVNERYQHGDSETNKTIIFLNSATECYMRTREDKNAVFLISTHNDSMIRNEEGELVPLVSLMDMDLREYVLTEMKLPKDKFRLYLTGAYKEGLTIRDLNVKSVFAEAFNDIDLTQILGRCRFNLDKFVVIANGRWRASIKRTADDCGKFLQKLEKETNLILKGSLLKERYDLQQRKKTDEEMKNPLTKYLGVSKVVVAMKDEENNIIDYKINHYLIAYYKYILDSYDRNLATVTQKKLILDKKEVSIRGDAFIEMLIGAVEDKSHITITEGQEIAEDKREEKVRERIEAALVPLQLVINTYINRPLTKELKQEVCEKAAEIGLVRSKNQSPKWTSVKKAIEGIGYEILEKTQRVEGTRKRISVIETRK